MGLLYPVSVPCKPVALSPRTRNRLHAGGVVLTVLVGGLLFGKSELASRMAARSIEETVSQLLGEDLRIGGARLDYVPLTVTFEGVLLTHPATGETVAAADSVTFRAGWEGWLPVLRRITLDRPLVELHLDEDGLREFRDIVRGPELPDAPRATEFPWKELRVHRGAFRLHLGERSVAVDEIRVDPGPGAEVSQVRLGSVRLDLGGAVQEARDVVFPDVHIAPDHAELPGIDLQFPGGTLSGRLAVSEDGRLSGALNTELRFAQWTAAPPAPPAPGEAPPPVQPWVDGTFTTSLTLGGSTESPRADGSLALTGLTLWQGEPGHLAPVRFGDLRGPWHVATDGTQLLAVLDHLQMDWAQGRLDIDARVGLEDGSVTGTVQAEGVHFADIMSSVNAAPTPWVDFVADVETHVTGNVSPFRLDGPFEVALTGLEVGDAPVAGPHDTILHIPWGSVEGDLVVDADHLFLDAHRVRAPRSHGRATADIGFAPTGPLTVTADLPEVDLAVLAPLGDIELGGLAEIHGTLAGPYTHLGADAQVQALGFQVLGLPVADTLRAHVTSDMVRLDIDDAQATLGEHTTWTGRYGIDFSRDNWMECDIDVTAGKVAELSGVFVDLGALDGDAKGTVSVVGTPYDLDGTASFELADVDLYGEPFPTGHAVGWMDQGEFTLSELLLTRPRPGAAGRQASLLARGSVKKDWKLDLDVTSDGFRLEEIERVAALGLPLRGDLYLDAHVGGTLFEQEPEGRLALRQVRYGDEVLAPTTIDFHTVELGPGDPALAWRGTVLGDAARVAGTLGFYGDQPYRLQAELRALPLEFFYPRGVDGSPIHARASGSLDLSGRFGDSPTPVDIVGRFDELVLDWAGRTLRNVEPWRFEVHQRTVDIPTVTLAGGDGTRVSMGGAIDSRGRVRLSGEGQVNLELARAFVPGLLDASGMGTVGFVMTRGDTGGADIRATLDLDGASLRTEYWPDTIEDLDAHVVATADRYTLTGVRANIGGGSFVGEPSSIEARGWRPSRYDLAGTLTDTRTRYLDYLPPIRGDARLSFQGPASDPLLGGIITIKDMVFRDRIDWESWVISLREERLTAAAPEASDRYFSMDIAVMADGTVQVRNNVADAEASARLRIVGDTARPGLVGDVRVRPGGRMYLHEREFEITRGEIRYLDPYSYDPDLDILLETDVRSQDADYHVTYAVTGPFSDWRTTTTSDPWLSQADINALLLFGVTREELEQYGGRTLGSALVAETGDLLLSQTALSRANPLIDRWSLVSGVSERGSSTVSTDLRFVATKQIGEFEVTVETSLGQSLGQDWYASVERRIAERLYASLYAATEQQGRSLPIGAAYGAEFKYRWEWD